MRHTWKVPAECPRKSKKNEKTTTLSILLDPWFQPCFHCSTLGLMILRLWSFVSPTYPRPISLSPLYVFQALSRLVTIPISFLSCSSSLALLSMFFSFDCYFSSFYHPSSLRSLFFSIHRFRTRFLSAGSDGVANSTKEGRRAWFLFFFFWNFRQVGFFRTIVYMFFFFFPLFLIRAQQQRRRIYEHETWQCSSLVWRILFVACFSFFFFFLLPFLCSF